MNAVNRHAKQVTLLDAMLKHAENLDDSVSVTVNGLGQVTRCEGVLTEVDGVHTVKSVRANLIALITQARADQQQRLAECEKES